ncbi:MAG: helix-turn-helix domain-containing protein [Phenylobacterium sp.]|uniref:helix-turn-helix domain-containing protein n=1 Tax=Phenylobacterium sp. TaxID=1871053 RepID=UPI00391D9874
MANLMSVEAARTAFFRDGRLPADFNHSVLRSWIRCSEMGLDASAQPRVAPMSAAELRAACDRHETLRRISRPELDALYAEARETGAIVILTNAEGVILDAVGDPGFAERAAQVALRPGAVWNEAGAGTNAIGTALAERRGVAVNGAEHFYAEHRGLTCAAAPIIDPRGAIVGALDMSGAASVPHAHALGLVRMAVEQIEHRLLRQPFEGCVVVRFHTDPNLLGAAREGVLVFKDERLVGANRRGLSLVGRGWEALDAARFEEIFAAPMETLGRRGALTTHAGDRFAAVANFPDDARDEPPVAAPGAGTLEDAELAAMRRALTAAGGNVSLAARRLGVHRSTLYRRLLSAGA